jgi:ABC-type Fe3+/spermidine/putrescine transport system ATPase subunit
MDARPKRGVSIGSAVKRYGLVVAVNDVSLDVSDRVAVVQIGTPERRYDRPCNAFVASFMARRRGRT